MEDGAHRICDRNVASLSLRMEEGRSERRGRNLCELERSFGRFSVEMQMTLLGPSATPVASVTVHLFLYCSFLCLMCQFQN